MLKPEHVPDVVVAAARDAWLMSDVNAKEDWRSAIAAAINAWPGSYSLAENDSAVIRDVAAIILPLPQEKNDE